MPEDTQTPNPDAENDSSNEDQRNDEIDNKHLGDSTESQGPVTSMIEEHVRRTVARMFQTGSQPFIQNIINNYTPGGVATTQANPHQNVPHGSSALNPNQPSTNLNQSQDTPQPPPAGMQNTPQPNPARTPNTPLVTPPQTPNVEQTNSRQTSNAQQGAGERSNSGQESASAQIPTPPVTVRSPTGSHTQGSEETVLKLLDRYMWKPKWGLLTGAACGAMTGAIPVIVAGATIGYIVGFASTSKTDISST